MKRYCFAICVAWLVCISTNAVQAQSQSSSSPPSAVILSGGSSSRVGSSAPFDGLRDPISSSAWTASSNASARSRRADTELLSSGGYASGSPVVAAAAQVPVADETADVQQPNALLPRPAAYAGKSLRLNPPSQTAATNEAKGSSSGTLQMLLSVGSSLCIVVGLFLGVAWCYRKTLNSSAIGGLPKQVVNVLGRTSLSARQQMVLVHFGNKLLLVSVVQGEARTLSEITDPLQVDQLVGLCESSHPSSITNSFKSVLLQEGSR